MLIHPCTVNRLLAGNREWAQITAADHPQLLQANCVGQTPATLWIGCSDSRVPPTCVVKGRPGDLFVHRNIANVVSQDDDNLLAVLQYAVDNLGVAHVIVCGHYGCGGVQAALEMLPATGPLGNWLGKLRLVIDAHAQALRHLDAEQRWARLCELNALQQAYNLCQTAVVQNAWRQGRQLCVHAWIFSLRCGHIMELGFSVAGSVQLDRSYTAAVEQVLRNSEVSGGPAADQSVAASASS